MNSREITKTLPSVGRCDLGRLSLLDPFVDTHLQMKLEFVENLLFYLPYRPPVRRPHVRGEGF